MNYRKCYEKGVILLEKNGVPEPENDAVLLLEFVCGTNRNTLLAHGDSPVAKDRQSRYEELIQKRAQRVPLQILTGEQEFCGLPFWVNEHVLIPRQDTEILVEQALKKIKPGMKVLDMCTGSGCILISLLVLAKGIFGAGADISQKALEVAKANGERLLPEAQRPEWYCGDLFAALPTDLREEKRASAERGNRDRVTVFDMIVSNPPYIPSKVIETLMPEVRNFEPVNALDGSTDGLLFYRRIVEESSPYLTAGGFLLFEIGHDQGMDVKNILEKGGFKDVCIIKDYAGLDRVALGQK